MSVTVDGRGQQLGWIWYHMELRFLSTLHDYGRDTVEPIESALDFVSRHLPSWVAGYGFVR